MIKLSSGAVMLRTPEGARESLNLDALSDELWLCCRRAQLEDPELADNLIATVRRFVDTRLEEGASLTQRDVDDLIVRALTDLGVQQVAVEYARGCDLPTPSAGPELVPQPNAIAALLHDDLFFVHRPVKAIADATVRCIAALGFQHVTENLVLELAKSFCMNEEQTKRPGPARYWLLHRSEMPQILPQSLLPFLADQRIAMRSVSILFPTLVIDVDVSRFAQGEDVLGTELAFLPAFHDFCHSLSEVVDCLYTVVKNRCGDLQLAAVGANIHFTNVRTHAADTLGLPPREAVSFVDELEAIARRRLDDVYCTFE